MPFALAILLGLLALCPAIVTVGGPVIPYFIPLLLAAGLILVSLKLAPGEAEHMSTVISRPFVLAAAFPAVLMIVQILPLSFLANPVWTSVNPGFTRGVFGSISVDIGATAVALVSYLSAVGMVALAAAVAINRDRAESLLIGATAVTVFISVASLLRDLFGLNVLAMRDEARDCACLGVTLTAACAMLVFERHETRRSGTSKTRKKFPVAMAACLIAFVICAAAVWATRAGSLAFAAGSGFLTFIAIVAIRRWALGRLGAAAIGVTAAVIATALMGVAAGDPDPRFAFVKKDPVAIELTQRILNDAPFFGDGAGTFPALLPVYQTVNAGSRDAVTAAAKLSIEMGKAMLWAAVLAASFAVFILLRGAARRGRDSFYSAAAGACLVTLMNLAFISVGIFGPAMVLLSAAIFGLGLIQSKGRAGNLGQG
ncbi:hypothetical protein QEV83_15735 [Methylocapsa sp. D3K7]|uniref:hypothetical protein n=1 Tax=Methylocapsa sp. D3K7 TaxID=3041435 RepID=UPI00244E9853|nr:hypothetical protein [Methylocapsa sp. D3K7]WGJ14088.1 hypothetical protein QEV83_15735 [Methylocapsa sp. D3K7]